MLKLNSSKVTLEVDNSFLKHPKGCDVIFHLAAVLGVDIVADNPVETMDVR